MGDGRQVQQLLRVGARLQDAPVAAPALGQALQNHQAGGLAQRGVHAAHGDVVGDDGERQVCGRGGGQQRVAHLLRVAVKQLPHLAGSEA